MKAAKLNLVTLSCKPEYLGEAGEKREACRECGLSEHCNSPFMQPYIPEGWEEGERILEVGEAPGDHEDNESGRPFTGSAGKILRRLNQWAGLEKRDVAYVNAVRCRPRNNATPTVKQVRCCRPFLLRTI